MISGVVCERQCVCVCVQTSVGVFATVAVTRVRVVVGSDVLPSRNALDTYRMPCWVHFGGLF